MAPLTRRAATWALKPLLLGAQIGVALVSCELMYRAYLKWFANPDIAAAMTATLPHVLHVYWPEPFTFRSYGYDYGPPSRQVARLEMKRDDNEPFGYRVMNIATGIYDDYGNMPPVYSDHRANGSYHDVDYDKADLKILAFGSSFTAGSWPDILQYRLEQKTGLKVRVLNFGRDSCGVMQSMDVAAHFMPLLKPDIALVAFATLDLIAPRTWRGVSQWKGYPRLFISTTEEPVPTDKITRVLGDAALVSPSVGELLDELKTTQVLPAGGDPRIGRLVDQASEFAKYTARAVRKIELFDLTRSFIYNMVRYGDPYESVELIYPEQTGYKLLDIEDFRTDNRMMKALGQVQATGRPYELIHLPRLDIETARDQTMMFGKNGRPAIQERRLLQNLEQVTGRRVFHVASRLPEGIGDFSDYIQGPGNPHPNKRGASVFAEIISDYLIERHNLPRVDQAPPNASLGP